MTVWTLKSGTDRRFRAGHPWVFSNELTSSPKGHPPGGPVELRDSKGGFLARGYGNPSSLIAFRALSRHPEETEAWNPGFLLGRLKSALSLRVQAGLGEVSHRLCFGEADGLPGLVIDRYLVPSAGQLFVAQAHTAGADRWVASLPEVLESLIQGRSGPSWEETAILVRNDVGVRELEGIPVEEPRIAKAWKADGLGVRSIRLAAAGEGTLDLHVNLDQGQKTAFYLDQAANIRLLAGLVRRSPEPPKKILDLCSYVGQWSSQISRALGARGVEVTAVDASQPALDLARKNIEATGARVKIVKADVIGGLDDLASQGYDLVIADPPALIKNRKHAHAGQHAYLQLNTDVFRLVKREGWVVSCSCSALLGEGDFAAALSKAARRNGVQARWIARGTPSPDHPVLSEFPEGDYLKCWIGRSG